MHATTRSISGARSAPWYTHRWPWLLMLGPATVLAGGAFVTWLALRHPDAMVVDDYYKQGKAINQDLSRDRVAAGMHLALHARYDEQQGQLAGRITSFDRPLVAVFTIRLAHPTLPQKDIVLPVRSDGEGAFSVPLAGLEATHWRVSVEGKERDWRLTRTWNWAAKCTLDIVAERNE